ncbi:MAG: diguanylate cyclase [Thioploca sp.]|nr:diguanylate cyclase [Thioploca sp.]
MKVLIAEADIAVIQLLETWLPQWGYTAIGVTNGEAAWQILRAQDPPRLAILDWHLPQLDGLAVCQQIKKTNFFSLTYVILIADQTTHQNLVKCFEVGADDFLSKPIQLEELHCRLTVGKRLLRYQEELTYRSEQWHTLLSAIPGIVVLKDEQGHWLQVNEAGLQLFQLSGIDYIGKTDEQLAQLAPVRTALLKVLSIQDETAWKQADILHNELEFLNEQGKFISYELIRVPLFDRAGRRKNMILLGHEVTAQKILQHRLHQETKYDPLTNLLNYQYFEEHLEAAINYSKRFKHPLSIAIGDIDQFTSILDTYGTQVAEGVIKQFSQIILEKLRNVDIVGRLGRDQFGIVFSGSTAHESLTCLNRIRERLEDTLFQNNHGDFFSISGSFGMADWLNHKMSNKDDLFKAANQALYHAKAKGYNQVTIYNDID